MDVNLHYGSGVISFQVPDRNVREIIRPWQGAGNQDAAQDLGEAIARQAGTFPEEVAGKRVCVLLDDGTRNEPLAEVLPPVCALLKPTGSVQFLICTGTHQAQTPGNDAIRNEVKRISREAGLTVTHIHVHDCHEDAFLDVGRTSYGTQVQVNALAAEADVFVVIADVKVHYFSGYSNPVKNFLPGICSFDTVEKNHSLALLDKSTHAVHPWHPNPRRRDNPVAADQVEGMELIARHRPVYALTMLSAAGRVIWERFGPIEATSAEAFRVTDERNIRTVTPASRLVVAPGGLPNDQDLYIAQRALELNRAAVVDGGEVLFLAACPDGIGEPQTLENFYNRLTDPLENVIASIHKNYVLYSHKPYKFALMIRRLRHLWMHTEIPDPQVQAAHLDPAHDPQAIVDGWLAEDPEVQIIFIDGANKVALQAV